MFSITKSTIVLSDCKHNPNFLQVKIFDMQTLLEHKKKALIISYFINIYLKYF